MIDFASLFDELLAVKLKRLICDPLALLVSLSCSLNTLSWSIEVCFFLSLCGRSYQGRKAHRFQLPLEMVSCYWSSSQPCQLMAATKPQNGLDQPGPQSLSLSFSRLSHP